MGKIPELQVVIPYKTFVELLKASEDVPELIKENKRLTEQLTALRIQFTELLEAFGELKSYVSD